MYKVIATCLAAMFFQVSDIMAQQTKTVTLRFIETSDVHGAFFPYDFIERTPKAGTMARVSSYVNKLRSEMGDRLILLDNGDILQGQPTCYYSNYVKTGAENIAAKVTNYLGYDAATVGNHDIETGHAVYDKWIKENKCDMLGANIIDVATEKPYLKPYTIIERDGVRVAVLGSITPAIPNWLNESLWSGLRFEPILDTARKWVDLLKNQEKADVVVGLFHSGWNGGISTLHYNEDEAELVAKNVPGFDIVFFGHDHRERKAEVVNVKGETVLCLDPSCNAINVADAEVTVVKKAGRLVSKTVKGEIHNVCDEPVDEAFDRYFQADIDSVKAYVGRKIGYMGDTIRTRDCFFGSAAFTDLIHNLQLAITGADISFNAPLSFDVTVDKGPLYMSDMFKLYRYENQLYVLRMTGEEIRKHLEMSYDQWVNTMKTKDDHILLLDEGNKADMQKYGFRNLTFNFDSAAGIDYVVDVTKPNGQKVIIKRMSNGQKFDERKWYKVVMNSYRGNGGGELVTKGAGIPKDSLQRRIVYQSKLDQRYYLTQEIERLKTIAPKPNDNWRFVPDDWAKPALARDRKLIFGD